MKNQLWGYIEDESDKEHSDDTIEAPVHGRLRVHSSRVLVDDAMEGDTSALEKPESQRKHIETQYRLQALAVRIKEGGDEAVDKQVKTKDSCYSFAAGGREI